MLDHDDEEHTGSTQRCKGKEKVCVYCVNINLCISTCVFLLNRCPYLVYVKVCDSSSASTLERKLSNGASSTQIHVENAESITYFIL